VPYLLRIKEAKISATIQVEQALTSSDSFWKLALPIMAVFFKKDEGFKIFLSVSTQILLDIIAGC